jgi:hypothetical protein
MNKAKMVPGSWGVLVVPDQLNLVGCQQND